MGLPWQGDTAYCRSGYDPDFDPYLPTFWPGRVPNQVLTEEDYQIVIDTSQPLADRIAAFNRRASWYRFIDQASPAEMYAQAGLTSDQIAATALEALGAVTGQFGAVKA